MLPSDNEAAAWASPSVYSMVVHQHRGDVRGGQAAETQPLATRSHGRQQHVRAGRHEDECRCRRRLLERLQQRILRLGVQRVRVVHDHDAAPALERPICRALDRFAHLIDLDDARIAWLENQDVGVHASRDPLARARARPPLSVSPVRLATGPVQFINWASATAAIRFPTPSGPAKIRLGGKVPRVAARAIRSSRWPVPGDGHEMA